MLVAQQCPTLCDSMVCSPTGSSVHGIFQARILAYRSYPTLKVRKVGSEEIALVQGKEEWLCFAGAAAKRFRGQTH